MPVKKSCTEYFWIFPASHQWHCHVVLVSAQGNCLHKFYLQPSNDTRLGFQQHLQNYKKPHQLHDVCLHGTTQLPLDKFSRNLIFEDVPCCGDTPKHTAHEIHKTIFLFIEKKLHWLYVQYIPKPYRVSGK